MTNVAIIPARGGSKRIPNKNIKLFLGKPIIFYSIAVAIKSQLFNRIIVSTDSEEIADYAKSQGAEVPFLRPAELADDFSGTNDVVAHALEYCALDSEGGDVDYGCCIYPTSPLLSSEALVSGYNLIKDNDSDYVVSVCEFDFPIQRAVKIDENNLVVPDDPAAMLMRSQDLPSRYHDAGQFYWGDRSAFIEKKPIWSASTKAVVLPASLVQDIDTEEDWTLAEIKYKHAYG